MLITGGTGMIGQHLIEQLMLFHSDYTIYVLYRNEKKLEPLLKYSNFTENNNKIEFVRGGISYFF